MHFADSSASLLIRWRQLRDDELHQRLNNIRQIQRAGFRLRIDYWICWMGALAARLCCEGHPTELGRSGSALQVWP